MLKADFRQDGRARSTFFKLLISFAIFTTNLLDLTAQMHRAAGEFPATESGRHIFATKNRWPKIIFACIAVGTGFGP